MSGSALSVSESAVSQMFYCCWISKLKPNYGLWLSLLCDTTTTVEPLVFLFQFDLILFWYFKVNN